MILSKQSIRKRCDRDAMVVRKDDVPLNIQPASIDVHLDELLIETDTGVSLRKHLAIPPGMFCLGSLIETFSMPNDLVGFVQGKSTLAREGLQIEAAGLIDPEFYGSIVLEIKNLHHREPIKLESGQPIGQVYFVLLDEPVDEGYGPGNHYQGQKGVTPSYRKVDRYARSSDR